MKKIRGLCAATTLLIVLSVSVVAGDISTNAVPPPPPPASATATEPGHITTAETESTIESETLIAEITLSLLQLLAVF
jgi:hypothetical protein